MPTMRELKAEAREMGVSWEDVREIAEELRQYRLSDCRRDHEIRRRAYELVEPNPDCVRHWWRVFGNESINQFNGAFQDGDYTRIPGWDDVAQTIQCEFPEFESCDDPSQALFEFIKTPYNRTPTKAEVYREAIDFCFERGWHTEEAP